MKRILRRLWVLTVKELLQLLRDRVLLIATVYLFTLDIFLAASGVKLTLHNTNLAAFDQDRSHSSRDLISRFQPPYFNFKGFLKSPNGVFSAFDQGKIMAFLDIPDGFEQALKSGHQTKVQLLVDTSNSIMGYLVAGYSAQIISDFSQKMMFDRLGITKEMLERFPIINLDSRVFFNSNQEEPWFTSLSELLTVITMLTMLLPAAALVREKERGTVEQLLVSPVSTFEILISKILAMTIVILVGTAVSVGFIIEGIFHVPIRSSLSLFFLITAFYVFTSCGYGLFIGTIARNLAQVGLMTIIGIAPIVFLSGTWTPPEAMPVWLRSMMIFSPLYYFIQASFGIFLKGVGWKFLWTKVLGMIFLGLGVLLLSIIFFRKHFVGG